MSKTPVPKVEDVERISQQVLQSSDTNNDKRISFPEFLSYTTKSKEILGLLQHYTLITKDDLRCSFVSDSELPDCDSDLENEVLHKGGEKPTPLFATRTEGLEARFRLITSPDREQIQPHWERDRSPRDWATPVCWRTA